MTSLEYYAEKACSPIADILRELPAGHSFESIWIRQVVHGLLEETKGFTSTQVHLDRHDPQQLSAKEKVIWRLARGARNYVKELDIATQNGTTMPSADPFTKVSFEPSLGKLDETAQAGSGAFTLEEQSWDLNSFFLPVGHSWHTLRTKMGLEIKETKRVNDAYATTGLGDQTTIHAEVLATEHWEYSHSNAATETLTTARALLSKATEAIMAAGPALKDRYTVIVRDSARRLPIEGELSIKVYLYGKLDRYHIEIAILDFLCEVDKGSKVNGQKCFGKHGVGLNLKWCQFLMLWLYYRAPEEKRKNPEDLLRYFVLEQVFDSHKVKDIVYLEFLDAITILRWITDLRQTWSRPFKAITQRAIESKQTHEQAAWIKKTSYKSWLRIQHTTPHSESRLHKTLALGIEYMKRAYLVYDGQNMDILDRCFSHILPDG